jgi:8-oxo-dGTP pyrophosphatase MutT (NUDIX family)
MTKNALKNDKPHLKVQVWIAAPDPKRPKTGWKVLLLKMLKDRGGYWQPVTGSVEKGERLPKAALREAVEETGIDFPKKPQALDESFCFESRWGGVSEEHGFFLITPLSGQGKLPKVKLDPKEHTDYEWLAPSRAAQRLGFASNRKMLRVLQQRLRALRKTNSPNKRKTKEK